MMKLLLCLFAFIPLVFTQVNVFPPEVLVSHVGGRAEFTCLSSSRAIQSISWIINGSFISDLSTINAMAEFSTFAGGTGVLTFDNLALDLNMTTIRCRAEFAPNVMITSTEATILLVQGSLSAVLSLNFNVSEDSIITYSWKPPPTLDIEDRDNDIDGYCIEVVNSITLETLHSECNLTATNYSYAIPPKSWCFVPLFTVIPLNIVGKGEPSTKSYVGAESSPEFVDMTRLSSIGEIMFTMSAPVCSADLVLVDQDTGEIITLKGDDLTIAETNITFSVEENHRYSITIKASNILGPDTSMTQLSTHGVSEIEISALDEIKVKTTYVGQSLEKGVFLIFIKDGKDGVIDFVKSAILPLNRNASIEYSLPFDLFPGRYRALVYDIEEDGSLSDGVGYPAVITGDILIRADSQGFESQPTRSPGVIDSCTVTSIFRVISVECVLAANSKATGFQMIAQLTNSSEVHILYVNRTRDGQTSTSVQVKGSGLYQVTIFALQGRRGIVDSDPEHRGEIMVITAPNTPEGQTPTEGGSHIIALILGAILGTLSLAVIVGFIAALVAYLWKKIKSPYRAVSSRACGASSSHRSHPENTHLDAGTTAKHLLAVDNMQVEISETPQEIDDHQSKSDTRRRNLNQNKKNVQRPAAIKEQESADVHSPAKDASNQETADSSLRSSALVRAPPSKRSSTYVLVQQKDFSNPVSDDSPSGNSKIIEQEEGKNEVIPMVTRRYSDRSYLGQNSVTRTAGHSDSTTPSQGSSERTFHEQASEKKVGDEMFEESF